MEKPLLIKVAVRTKKMAGKTGLEPATSTVTGWHSNQLSYFPAAPVVSDTLNLHPNLFFSSPEFKKK